MRQAMYIIVIILTSLILISLVMWWEHKKTPRGIAFVRIRNIEIPVEVKADPEGRMWGLSWRASLPQDSGMLFLFPQEDRYAFWMKDMKFPLDFIWIADGEVKEVTANVPILPLQTYRPQAPVDAVLELNAGFAEAYHIRVGDPVEFFIDKRLKIE